MKKLILFIKIIIRRKYCSGIDHDMEFIRRLDSNVSVLNQAQCYEGTGNYTKDKSY